jgi:hypothetical protein
MKMLFTVVALSALFAGCAGSPIALSNASPETLRTASKIDICHAYAFGGHSDANLRAEIVSRQMVRDDMLPVVNKGAVQIGMTEMELVCARGAPRKVNDSASAAGVRRQWIYGGTDRYMPTEYFYTDGKYVTGWN